MPDRSDTMTAVSHGTISPLRAAAQYTHHLAADPATRAVGAVGLIAVGIIHALEIPGQLSGAVWLTTGFCLLAVVAPIAGLWLLVWPAALAWQLGGVGGHAVCARVGKFSCSRVGRSWRGWARGLACRGPGHRSVAWLRERQAAGGDFRFRMPGGAGGCVMTAWVPTC